MYVEKGKMMHRSRQNLRIYILYFAVIGLLFAAAGHAGASSGSDPSKVAGSSEPRLVREAYSSEGGAEREAFVYLPGGYGEDPNRVWPVLYFLHGDGERGDGKGDLDWVLVHGPLYEAWIQKRDLGFIIVAPQLPLFGRDKTIDYIGNRDPASIPRREEEGAPPRPVEFPTPDPMLGSTLEAVLPLGSQGLPDGWPKRERDLIALLDQVLESYLADPDRVYLTGLSYGGFGTWWLASKHPDRFAAIAPVAGWGHPDLMPSLAAAQKPVWAFAGGRDTAVRAEYFYKGLNRLEELGHRDVRFTIHEDRGHDVWRRVYAGQDLYDWLLSHRLGE